jgi:hypothetical protein
MKHLLKQGKITAIEPEEGGGLTREVHLLTHLGQKYILRQCPDLKTADKYEKIYYALEKFGFLPELLYRDRTRMIFEYLPGRDCRVSDALRVAQDVGTIAGAINSTRIPFKQYDFDEKFFDKLEFLKRKRVLDTDKSKEVRDLYYELKRKAKPKLAIDANDITNGNFRISDGQVYFVDIEAIKPVPKGCGIAKAMLKWFRTPTQRERFFKGYNKFGDSSFLTPDYRDFVYLYFIINNIYHRNSRNQLKPHNLERLDRLLAGQEL